MTKLADLPVRSGKRSAYRVVRYDANPGRVIVSWEEGELWPVRAGAVFVDLTTSAITEWDLDPASAAVAVSRVGASTRAIERRFESALVRWHREIEGATGTILQSEHPNGESQLVRRDAAGKHPIVLDHGSFDSDDHSRGATGRLAWVAYVRRHAGHMLMLAVDDTGRRAPTPVPAAPGAMYPTWDSRGEAVYAIARDKIGEVPAPLTAGILSAHHYCFVRVVAATAKVTPIRCSVEPDDMHVVFNADRSRAAVIVGRADRTADVELVALPSGESLGRTHGASLETSLRVNGVLDERDRLIAPAAGRGITVVDPRSGRAWIARSELAILDVAQSGRLPDGRWVAVRGSYGDKRRAELVAIDVERIAAGEPATPPSEPTGPVDRELPVWRGLDPCRQTATTRATPAGTEHGCIDKLGKRTGPYAIVQGGMPIVHGSYEAGKRHGTWRWWSRGALRVEIEYSRGIQHGMVRGWHPHGQRAVRTAMREGRANGPLAMWYPSGERSFEGTLRAGSPDGAWREWWENGSKKAELEYRGGKVVGTSRRYSSSGVLAGDSDWRNGRATVRRERDKLGRVENESRLDSNGDATEVVWYHATGEVRQRSVYSRGRPGGTTRIWDESGTLTLEECWRGEARTRGACD